MSDQPREFDCVDCGIHVVSFGVIPANDQPICAQCMWIRAIPDERDRQRLREFLGLDKLSKGK